MIKIILLILVLSMESKIIAQNIYSDVIKGEKRIEVASNGTIYLFNLSSSVLSRYNEKGILNYSIGGQGFSDDRFDRPTSFHLSAGLTLLVCDTGNKRVMIYDRNLQKIGEINQESSPKSVNWSPAYVVMNNVGQIWVCDSENQRLIQFDENGYLRFEVFLPEEIDMNSIDNFILSQNYLWLIDEGKQLAYRFSNLGKYQLFMALPKDVKRVKSINRMIMGIQGNDLVQISENGTIVSKIKRIEMPKDGKKITGWSLMNKSFLISTESSILFYPIN